MRRAVALQSWADIAFLHWRAPVPQVQALLPPGLTVDALDGSAWLGVTPFRMQDVRAPGVPALPGWSTFPECNVRTYVRGPDGRDGLWFLRLVCPRRAVVLALRTVGLPYVHGDGTAVVRHDRATYRFARLGARDPAPFECDVDVGASLPEQERTPLVDALTGRWSAWTWVAGRLLRVPVEHEPWPLRGASARLRAVPGDVGELALPAETPPELVHFSSGVRSRIGLPHVVGRRRAAAPR